MCRYCSLSFASRQMSIMKESVPKHELTTNPYLITYMMNQNEMK